MYLCYPIDQARGTSDIDNLYRSIEEFKIALVKRGEVGWVFDPGDAFKVGMFMPDEGLARINRAALNNSDCVVAFLPEGVPSVGVPIEIDRARAQGKHVIVFSNAQSWMLEMPGLVRFLGWGEVDLDHAVNMIRDWAAPDESPILDDLPVRLDGGVMPFRTYDDDAGLDLVVSEATTILPGTFQDVPCGLAVELPHWSWGLVTGRSSALRKRGLLVHSGVIDAGYRGPIYSGAWNMTDQPVVVEKGERIAQLILIANGTRRVVPIQVEQLNPSARGESGFGSTGA